MLTIRLQRVGKKNSPSFRLVLTDSRNAPKSGRFLEILGSYNPRDKKDSQINKERISYWISKGVTLSDTVHNMLVNTKVVAGAKRNAVPPSAYKAPAPKEETPAKEEAKVEENSPVNA